MCWEQASWIATTFGSILGAGALLFVAYQVHLERKRNRREALDRLYGELDTHEARLDREYIYKAKPEQLKMDYLHAEDHKQNRKSIESTLANMERVAYRIYTKQIPSEDAFNLWGGSMLSVANKLWPYVEDQRKARAKNIVLRVMKYRKYLEAVVRDWVPKMASAIGVARPAEQADTGAMLKELFTNSNSAQG